MVFKYIYNIFYFTFIEKTSTALEVPISLERDFTNILETDIKNNQTRNNSRIIQSVLSC